MQSDFQIGQCHRLSFLVSLPSASHRSRWSFNGGRSVYERGAAMRHTTVSPRNPFCVAWGGSGRGVHRVVDVGHAEYRAGGRLAAECTLHCWHTLLCNCWHSALHTSCRLERHTVGTAWIAAREVGRVEARIAAAMARPRGDGGAGGGRATQCNSHLPICLQCPATSYMSAMDTAEHNLQKLDKSDNSA